MKRKFKFDPKRRMKEVNMIRSLQDLIHKIAYQRQNESRKRTCFLEIGKIQIFKIYHHMTLPYKVCSLSKHSSYIILCKIYWVCVVHININFFITCGIFSIMFSTIMIVLYYNWWSMIT